MKYLILATTTKTHYVKHLDKVREFETREIAQTVCEHFQNVHNARSRKKSKTVYKVIPLVNGHGTG